MVQEVFIGAAQGQHPENASTCKSLIRLSMESTRIPKIQGVHVGRARAYSALSWFKLRRHTAGRLRENKMFPTQASISPEPGAALSLSSSGEGGREEGGMMGVYQTEILVVVLRC